MKYILSVNIGYISHYQIYVGNLIIYVIWKDIISLAIRSANLSTGYHLSGKAKMTYN